ncbi:MAG: InlB B-repeat-containing protein [Bacteroidota bacterium]
MLSKLLIGLFCAIISPIFIGNVWGQVTIMSWDFDPANAVETNLPGGAAAITSNGITTATAGCTGFGYGGSAWVSGDYIQIIAPTTGYNIAALTLNLRSSGTGPAKLDVQYSSTGAGGPFTTLTNVTSGNGVCNSQSVDFSAINALDNNANVVIRLVGGNYGEADGSPNTGNPSGTGTLRIDDVVITGTVFASTSISTGIVTPNLGATFDVTCVTSETGTVAYSSSGTFTGTFTAQLSDASGSFASPAAIGTGPSPINVTIPANTPTGIGYKIRVVNDNPNTTGSESSVFTVNNACVIYTVIFNGNGNDGGSMSNQSASAATNLTVNAFTKTCATFSGWNTAANGSGTSYADMASYPFTANETLYAQWNNLPTFSVTFDANGGTGTTSGGDNLQSNCNATALDVNGFTRSGYSFTGWNSAANGSGTSYANNATYPFSSNITLYAQWIVMSGPCYTQNFEVGGGSQPINAVSICWTTSVSAAFSTTASDHTAGGSGNHRGVSMNNVGQWAQTPDLGGTVGGSVHYWTRKQNSGGSTSMKLEFYDATNTLIGDVTHTGVTFTWAEFTDPLPNGTYFVRFLCSDPIDGIHYDDIEIFGCTGTGFHTVIFDANGGSGSMPNQISCVAANLNTNTFTQSGCTFMSWNTASNGSGTSFANMASYSFAADITLYAIWDCTTYCINENFDASTSVPAGWAGNSAHDAVATHYSSASNCRGLGAAANLITPAVDYPNTIGFYLDASGSGGQVVSLSYSTDGGSTWSAALTTFTASTAGSVISYPLSAPLTTTLNVKFRLTSASSTAYIDDLTITCGTPPPCVDTYFRSFGSGNWTDVAKWEMSPNGSTGWVAACTYPTATNSDGIVIQNGHTITLDLALTEDNLTIDNGGTLILPTTIKMTLNDGIGTDLTVNGTLVDNNNTANSILWNGASTWSLGAAATIIKTSTSSVINYRDNYLGGISTIPATASWIYRYTNNGNVIVNAVDMYYPNLYIESTSGNHTWTGSNEVFVGSTGTATIKGNFYVGSTGTGLVSVYNNNFNASPITVLGNVFVGAGSLLSNQDQSALNGSNGTGFDIKGNVVLTTPGIYDVSFGTGTTTFSGSSLQTISGGGTFKTYRFTLNNTSGASLSATDMEVTNNLTFQSANGANQSIIYTTGTSKVNITNSATTAIVNGVAQSSQGRYIQGRLQWSLATGNTYTYPIGYAGYGAQGFTFSPTGNGNVLAYLQTRTQNLLYNYAYCDVATTTNGGGANIGTSGINLTVGDGILDQISLDQHSPLEWEITQPSGSISSYNITVLATGAQALTLPPATSFVGPLRYLSKNGQPGNPAVATTIAPDFTQIGFNICPNNMTLNGMTSFSLFTIDAPSANSEVILPIELISFEGKLVGRNQAELIWITASEVNNDYFTLAHSRNGIDWQSIAIIDGAGNSNSHINYAFHHENLDKGIHYYHLASTDVDGTVYDRGIVAVEVEMTENSYYNAITQSIELYDDKAVNMYTSDGKLVLTSTGRTSIPFNYSTGVYLIQHLESGITERIYIPKN